jgi:hypothetical protein
MRVRPIVLSFALVISGCPQGDDQAQTPDVGSVVERDGSAVAEQDAAVPVEDAAVIAPDAVVIVDMAATLDLQSTIVSPQQFDPDLAAAICRHLLQCGRLDNASMVGCLQRHRPAERFDRAA